MPLLHFCWHAPNCQMLHCLLICAHRSFEAEVATYRDSARCSQLYKAAMKIQQKQIRSRCMSEHCSVNNVGQEYRSLCK